MVDLGAWLREEYRVPVSRAEEALESLAVLEDELALHNDNSSEDES